MKRSMTSIVLGAALMALPASGLAQTPPQPPSAQPPATQPPAAQTPATEESGAQSAAEHLAKAKSALNEIEVASVTGKARTRLTELKRHVAALDRAVSAQADPPTSSRSKSQAMSWATEVAAVDRILTELTTPTTSASDPAVPTGTSGTAGTTGTSRAQGAVTVDETTRAKLLEVRTHITAFASAMSGTAASPSPSSPSAAPATEPTSPPQPPTTEPPATQPPTATPPDPSTAGTPASVDQEAARRHLTEARDVLSQLTQLPEAAQLTGDARTQVTELITNFNELITTQNDWRASFTKVQANLTALVGAERTDEANVPPPSTGTAGAVGTSGMTTLDPKLRDKLIEFRTKLAAFEKAAGGK